MPHSWITTKLKELPKDTKIYTSLVSVSRSGMTRNIKAYVVINGEIVHLNALAKDFPDRFKLRSGPRDSFVVKGCGMDMGYHLVYNIGMVLHNDGYHFKQVWL